MRAEKAEKDKRSRIKINGQKRAVAVKVDNNDSITMMKETDGTTSTPRVVRLREWTK